MLVGLLSLAGCTTASDPSDPGDDDDEQMDTSPEPDTTQPDTMEPDSGMEQDTEMVDSGDDGGTGPCTATASFNGQVANSMDQHGGGTVADSADVLPQDAGVQAVKTYIVDNKPSGCTGSGDCGGNIDPPADMRVEGAIVTATDFGSLGNKFFYIEDQQAGLYVRLTQDHPEPGPEGTTVNVGDEVSFDVDQLGVFAGEPQIQRFRAPDATEPAFSIDSPDNAVPVRDFSEMSPTPDEYHRLVKVHGSVTNESTCDSEQDCANNMCWKCYDLMRDGEKIATLRSQEFTGTRTNDQGQEVPRENPGYFDGACVTYVGPVGMFPGPLEEGADGTQTERLQLEVENFSWTDR